MSWLEGSKTGRTFRASMLIDTASYKRATSRRQDLVHPSRVLRKGFPPSCSLHLTRLAGGEPLDGLLLALSHRVAEYQPVLSDHKLPLTLDGAPIEMAFEPLPTDCPVTEIEGGWTKLGIC